LTKESKTLVCPECGTELWKCCYKLIKKWSSGADVFKQKKRPQVRKVGDKIEIAYVYTQKEVETMAETLGLLSEKKRRDGE